MNRIIRFCFVSALLYACSPEIERVVVQTYPDGKVELEKYYFFKGNDSILVKEVGYYQEGGKRIEGSYKEEKREGQWTYWYDNGNKWSEANYKSDVREGKSTVWHENGQKYYEGNYKAGERAGLWRFWNESGTLIKEINYDK